MIETPLVQAVFDEAGDTGQKSGSSRYLVVAGIVCANLDPLRRVVARTRKSLGKRLKDIPELKAWHTPDKIVSKLLNQLASLDIEIYAAILDKRSAKPPTDPEDWYRLVYGEAVRQVLNHHPRAIVTIDKRYTKATLRDELLRAIVTRAQRPDTTLSFVLADSQGEKALQTVDAVAWSIFQKYEHEEEMFYQLIEQKIAGEIALRK